tara:strand:+ start:60 stop:395 length:336 start_codon:yes stop_codon:yes gene_type:complete
MSTTELLSEISGLEDDVESLRIINYSLKSAIQEFEKFLISYNVISAVENKEFDKLQELIRDCLSDEDGDETDEFDNDDPYAQTDEEVQTEHWQTDRGEPHTGRYEGHGVGQ